MTDTFDIRMMRLALATAHRQLGQTAPNPAVGAVIANPEQREVISVAATAPGGRPHAETEAIARAGARATGQTLYVTLEPCAHHGQTPPCADAIIAAGLKRVVIGVQDPDPRVAGQGAARLRHAGLAVQCGLCGPQAKRLVLGHLMRVTEHRPLVQLKIAIGRDGRIPKGSAGKPVWVTSGLARQFGHQMRAEADAILIGGETLRADNPDLTCRLPGLEAQSPMRIVVSTDWKDLHTTQLFETRQKVPVYFSYADDSGQVLHRLEAAPETKLPAAQGPVQCMDLLAELAGRGVTRLLVEGGPAMWRWFCASGVVDEVVAFIAEIERADDAALVNAKSNLNALLNCQLGECVDVRQVGRDCRLQFQL